MHGLTNENWPFWSVFKCPGFATSGSPVSEREHAYAHYDLEKCKASDSGAKAAVYSEVGICTRNVSWWRGAWTCW